MSIGHPAPPLERILETPTAVEQVRLEGEGPAGSLPLTAELLRSELSVPVRLWNESYSTVEAHRRRREARLRRRHQYIDAEAAAVLLQDYLDAQR